MGRKENARGYDYSSTLQLLSIIQEILPVNSEDWSLVQQKFNKWSQENAQSLRKRADLKKKYGRLYVVKVPKEIEDMISIRDAMRIAEASGDITSSHMNQSSRRWERCDHTKAWKHQKTNIHQHGPRDAAPSELQRQSYDSTNADITQNKSSQHQGMNPSPSSSFESLVLQQQEKLNQVQSQIIILQQMQMQIQEKLREAESSRNQFMQAAFSLTPFSKDNSRTPQPSRRSMVAPPVPSLPLSTSKNKSIPQTSNLTQGMAHPPTPPPPVPHPDEVQSGRTIYFVPPIPKYLHKRSQLSSQCAPQLSQPQIMPSVYMPSANFQQNVPTLQGINIKYNRGN